MKADLAGQIHELMETGIRPVTMADIETRAPVRMTALQRAAARSRLAAGRLAAGRLAAGRLAAGRIVLAPGGSPAPRSGRGTGRRGNPRWPRRAVLAAIAAAACLAIAA